MKITVIGVGKIGSEIAKRLSKDGHDIIVIDRNEDRLTKLGDKFDVLTIKGNGANALLLKDPDIIDSDLLVAVTDSDEVNMIACLMAKKLGIKQTVARVRDPVYVESDTVLSTEELGVDLIINPEYSAAAEIARLLSLPVPTEPFAGGRVHMARITLHDKIPDYTSKKIAEIKLPKSLLIVAISRHGQLIIPSGNDTIKVGDTLYFLGFKEAISQISKILFKKPPGKKVYRTMILGGGKIGYYLAQRLCAKGLQVVIVEKNHDKCEELAERLPSNALVLEGDGSDIELLQREGIEHTDGFVTVTGLDEANLLLAHLAKQLGAKRTIAKISRQAYTSLVEQMDIDAAISPQTITASKVLRYIRGGRLLSLVLLFNEQAEIVELIVPQGSKVTGKPLMKLKLPKGIIVGAIQREDKTVIPTGEESIEEGDRIVVFAQGQYSISNIESLFTGGRVH
ncbi:MAG: Trk system potassium transporter TrkA [Peptococcaceae bacterium]|nr:Trk system potassium transporter TrkA [Peptococcaceae bacterium]